MSPAEARLKEVPSDMTEAEWNQRINLAACYRLVALYGWDDLVDTHISARVPGPEHHFLINPYGLMFDEITASSLVKVDLDGNQLTKSDYSINPAGFTIHSAIHEVREDAGCVLHLHTPDGTAVSSCMEGLLPLNQTAQLVTFDLAYHDYEGIALDHDERPRLQRDLGDKNHMLLRNHGTHDGRPLGRFRLRAHVPSGARLHHAGPHPDVGAFSLSGRRIRGRQEHQSALEPRPRRIALDDAGVAAAAAQARPDRSQLQELKFDDFRVRSPPTTSALPNQNAAQFRAAFLFESASVSRNARFNAARRRMRPESGPRSGCPCESSSGRIFRSANGCCRHRDRSRPARYRDRACA